MLSALYKKIMQDYRYENKYMSLFKNEFMYTVAFNEYVNILMRIKMFKSDYETYLLL